MDLKSGEVSIGRQPNFDVCYWQVAGKCWTSEMGSEAAILIAASLVPAVLEAIQLLGMSRHG